MSDAFVTPPGDPGGVRAAAARLHQVASDLGGQQGPARAAVATSVRQWHGPRAQDFAHAGGGLQVELLSMTTAASTLAGLLDGYASVLEGAQHQIVDLKRQWDAAAADTALAIAHGTPQDSGFTQRLQSNASRQSMVEGRARQVAADLFTAAGRLAAAVDVETDMAVPGSASLSEADLRRRVTEALGVSSLPVMGPPTPDETWAAVMGAAGGLPPEDVTAEGEVKWSEVVAEFNDKRLAPPLSGFAIGTAPPAVSALARLIANQRELGVVARDVQTAFDAVVGPTMLEFDRGLTSLTDVNNALIRFRAVDDAAQALGPAGQSSEAFDAARAGGLSESGFIGAAGKLFAVVGVASDVMTIWNPGVDNPYEGNALRVVAAANIAGTGAAFFGGTAAGLIGLNAAVDWIPVVGEVVIVATGLILAGDYAYHHWDEISHFVGDTVPHALDTAAHAVGDALTDADNAINAAVDTAVQDVSNAVGTAVDNVGDALGSAADSVGDFVSGLF